jgi:prephenate dehydrogenase
VVGVVGAGLIGTSIGLALSRQGVKVLVTDVDPARAAAASALGAGEAVPFPALAAAAEHAVVAVPPRAAASAIAELLGLNPHLTVSDVTSVKANLIVEVETLTSHSDRFCPAHPIAGRERNGPGAAQPELFENAVWAITPTPATSEEATSAATAVAEACGARVVVLGAEEHDRVLAGVSHVPQLLASLLAGQLPATGPHGPELAGSGFRDATRLADSDPDLWSEIVSLNSGAVAEVLRVLADALTSLVGAVETGDAEAVRGVVAAGNVGRRLLPGKAVGGRPQLAGVGVVLADRPGELARLLGAAGAAGVNVEDLSIEHALDHPAGFVDLDVRPEEVDTLLTALGAAGWAAHRTR